MNSSSKRSTAKTGTYRKKKAIARKTQLKVRAGEHDEQPERRSI